ncbi:MAG: FAD-dependent oxidoreductase [Oscillospiraceae bacterium]|jgi:2,4-dienoyl-CoA reductase-like NADH-dependent reductase (Old Yellow Enzyme family)/thioredoxin reductase|nr:FAD-dependent oxidoreductase [Oscillospiraceae bacterium]
MAALKYPHLFQPLKVRGVVFRNRIFAAPQGFYNTGPDCLPNADAAAYWEIKARGGFASVSIGDCIVDSETGAAYAGLYRIDDPRGTPAFAALAGAVSRHGCVASAELSHAGMYAHSVYAAGRPMYGPVAIKDGKYGEVTEMPEEIIYRIIEAFGKAAAFAKSVGYGMVTIHAGHGWLLPQFWSRQLNTRKDKWGGSFENRMRLPLAVLESIRSAVGPSFPIEIRMSGTECNPAGYDLDEGIEFAKALDDYVDIIHVSAGNHEIRDSFVITHPSMFLDDGVNAKYAAEIKKHVKAYGATVGSFSNPAHMEQVLASGGADIIEVARQSLADPNLPIKARTGREDEIQECLRCMSCYTTGNIKRIHYCSINPVTSREREVWMAPAPRSKKTVLIAGGGVAGMQAAITASERGHKVILCEKSTRLGGVLLCEEKVPFKRHLADYLARQAMLVSRAAVDVRLNTEVTPELAASLCPDVIVAALGARPVKPPIPGIGGPSVIGAEEAYADPEKCGKKVVILGGGLVGIELGIFLGQLGRDVTILELQDRLSVEDRSLHTHALKMQIRDLGIDVHLSSKVTNITESGVSVTGLDGDGDGDGGGIGNAEYPADTVIYATGQEPLADEAIALHDCAAEFYQVGDCAAPNNIMNANHTAFVAAYDIGVV